MKLLYISGARLPSEMAHGLQIMQNCEAFAANGAEVSLWYARRSKNTRDVDLWTFYGVQKTFRVRKLPSFNLHAWLDGRAPAFVVQLAFYAMLITFGLAAGIGAWFVRPDVIYCRDPLALLVAGWLNPRRKVVWEAHSLKTSGRGAAMQRQILRRAQLTVAVTLPLRNDLLKLHADANILVAHDGIRAARFADLPGQNQARVQAGWPGDKFIVGYVGRLTTYSMTKGIDILIEAIADLPNRQDVAIALVGGPDNVAEQYRADWVSRGMLEANFLYAGQVASASVPGYLAAFDLCTMPFPRQDHFAYYSSPLKLFEYMASGRALIASDLPAWADVLNDEENALLFDPGKVASLTEAIDRLKNDAQLREMLAAQARSDVFGHYTWEARADAILNALN